MSTAQDPNAGVAVTSLQSESDRELLRRYAEGRDDRAFAVLVRRHGGLVAKVCGRFLGNPHDAEEAFQAVFMVLARRASSIRRKTSVAGWLYAVSVRVCLNEWRSRGRRPACDRGMNVEQLVELSQSTDPLELQELGQIIDQELFRLPPKLRDALVLCDVEGKSRPEAARLLQVPDGTLASRLRLARDTMRRRLTRRGCVLSSASLAATIASSPESAHAISQSLLTRTIDQAKDLVAENAVGSQVLPTGSHDLADSLARTTMLHPWKSYALALLLTSGLIAGGSIGVIRLIQAREPRRQPTVMMEDFSDGSVTDGSPGRWVSNDVGDIAIEDGGLVLQGQDNVNSIPVAKLSAVQVGSANLRNSSVRTQCRLLEGKCLGIILRLDDRDWTKGNGYYVAMSADTWVEIGVTGPAVVRATTKTDLDVKREDVVLQLDAIEDELSLWVWRPGQRRPRKPLLKVRDPLITSGNVAVYAMSSEFPARGDAKAIFRYIQVASESIPAETGS